MSRIAKEGIVSRDPEVVSGELVFTGTRVLAQNLVDYLKTGHLDEFPDVSREQTVAYLEMAHEFAEERLGAAR